MKHIKLIFFFITLFFTLTTSPVYALFTPNNKVGIHILHPSEIEAAARLVNSQGGDWGYVTIPIQPSDRDLEKWTRFMQQATQLHLIPILRITTLPHGGTWAQAQDTDLVDFANFLDELPWPIQERYIVVFNEVNRSQEWGGQVDPQSYSQILKKASLIFKQRSPQFFILPAGLDNALPNSPTSMSSLAYLQAMQAAEPDIWNYIDGWTSHAYPNPHFTASPYKTGWQSITSYRQELAFIKKSLPVFITETGWRQDLISQPYRYYTIAWQTWLQDNSVRAVTPFVLQGGADFSGFSFLDQNGNPTPAWHATFDLSKTAGQPPLSPSPSSLDQEPSPSPPTQSSTSPKYQTPLIYLLKIENFFRQLFHLPLKRIISINHQPLLVEVATTSQQIQQGLSHRSRLDPNQGMLFLFPQPTQAQFWMKNMNFPLDIIWIHNNTIVSFDTHLAPEGERPTTIYTSPQPVDAVLEVPAGYADKHRLKPGDKIKTLWP